MSLEKPSFSPKLPEYLLNECSPKDKYLLEQLSVVGQVQDWLVDETVKQSIKLEEVNNKVGEVDTKLRYTNGKIAAAMTDIQSLKDKNAANKGTEEEVEKIVKLKLFVQRYLLNKYALIGFIALSVGLFRIIDDEGSRQLLLKVLGLG